MIHLIGIGEILERRKIVTIIVLIDFGRGDAGERIRVGRGAFEAVGSAAAESGPSLTGHLGRGSALFQLQELQPSAELIDQLLHRPLVIVSGRQQTLDGGALLQLLLVAVPRMRTPSHHSAARVAFGTNQIFNVINESDNFSKTELNFFFIIFFFKFFNNFFLNLFLIIFLKIFFL